LLNDGESVAVDLTPHWWFLAKPVIALVASIGLGVVALVATDDGTTLRAVVGWTALAMIVLSGVWTISHALRWSTTNLVVTSDRIIFRAGVVAKRGVEIPLERVNTVHFSQSIVERLIGAGDLIIESGGENGEQHFTDVPRPGHVQRAIHVQLDERTRRPLVGWSGSDVATQLEKLEGMLERGTLSRDEFEAHKRRLLER
jgi:uncharacterized membrane protein YdbT with pleckstrin-like domain